MVTKLSGGGARAGAVGAIATILLFAPNGTASAATCGGVYPGAHLENGICVARERQGWQRHAEMRARCARVGGTFQPDRGAGYSSCRFVLPTASRPTSPFRAAPRTPTYRPDPAPYRYRPSPYQARPTAPNHNRPTYRQTLWGALAAGIYRGSPYRVGAGSAVNYTSRAAAEAAALARCQQALPYGGCRIVGTFSGGGCGYVTTGARGPTVGWGAGPTSARAYRNCVNQGVICKTPIGGCTTRR